MEFFKKLEGKKVFAVLEGNGARQTPMTSYIIEAVGKKYVTLSHSRSKYGTVGRYRNFLSNGYTSMFVFETEGEAADYLESVAISKSIRDKCHFSRDLTELGVEKLRQIDKLLEDNND